MEKQWYLELKVRQTFAKSVKEKGVKEKSRGRLRETVCRQLGPTCLMWGMEVQAREQETEWRGCT